MVRTKTCANRAMPAFQRSLPSEQGRTIKGESPVKRGFHWLREQDLNLQRAALQSELPDAMRQAVLLEEEQKMMSARMKALEGAAMLGETLKAVVQGFLESVLKSSKV
jgi:hypothetical protein